MTRNVSSKANLTELAARELEASASPAAALAIDYFVYRIALNAEMLAAALNGLDAFIFTAGIGENSARHSRACQ